MANLLMIILTLRIERACEADVYQYYLHNTANGIPWQTYLFLFYATTTSPQHLILSEIAISTQKPPRGRSTTIHHRFKGKEGSGKDGWFEPQLLQPEEKKRIWLEGIAIGQVDFKSVQSFPMLIGVKLVLYLSAHSRRTNNTIAAQSSAKANQT